MPAPELFIDIETRSRVDLKKYGVYAYANCPDFRILIASWALDDDPVVTARGHKEILEIPGLFDPDVLKVAHNSLFERVCFSVLSCDPGEYLPPEHWHDSAAVAGEWGLPQKLQWLGRALEGELKDEAGTRLINLFCKPNRKGEWNDWTTHPMEWLEFEAYCEQDVETHRYAHRVMPSWPTDLERRIFLADQTINDRGIAIDVPMARKAVEAGRLNAEEQRARVTELSGIENPGSVQQVRAWLEKVDHPVPNLRADTVSELLSGDLPEDVREVLELRQELALAAPKKFESALAAVLPDGRLHGTLKFFGAHTGRWAGRGTQVQNLPRHAFENEVDAELTILDLLEGERVSSDDLKRLVRPMFIPGPEYKAFTVVDYSAIEARVIAWLAGEEWALEAFRKGRDIYVETAERMGGLTRSQGKIAVLALGYNGGANSLRGMAGEGDDFINNRTDRELRDEYVVPWRRANARITRMWAELGDGFGDPAKIGKHLSMTESHDKMGRAVHLHLPSGRSISYHNTRWERYKVKDDRGRLVSKEGWRYADPKMPFNPKMRIGTYGGRLAENATQAVARDIMAAAIVRLEDQGYRVVAHVHDEIIVEGEHDVDEISSIMTDSPSWAYGLPVDGEGFTCRRYRKG